MPFSYNFTIHWLRASYFSQVTGASGFLGSHIVDQLLKQRYRVRACVERVLAAMVETLTQCFSMARPGKVEAVRSRYTQHAGNLEVIAIEDIVSGDFGLALKGACWFPRAISKLMPNFNTPCILGVTAVLHVASPLPGRGDAATVLNVSRCRVRMLLGFTD